MAKTSDDPKSDAGMPAQETQPAAGPAVPPQRPQIHIDDSKAVALYANFCRVMGTPEELIWTSD